jgi:uncharacterized membrane protein
MQSSDKPRATGRTRDVVIGLDKVILSLARHWLLFLNLAIFLYVGVPFAAPILMEAGLPGPARVIYGVYGGLCHQLGYRSWYLFGERAAYPRDIFDSYSGINPDEIRPDGYPIGLTNSRAFVGNERMGWKVATCERDVAIYGALLLGGLVYSLPAVNRRVKPLPWLAYILIGIFPIALDGFSQLFSQLPDTIPVLSAIPYRESTPLLRTLTGGLFGLANAWLAFPYLRQSAQEMEGDLAGKLARAGVISEAPTGG